MTLTHKTTQDGNSLTLASSSMATTRKMKLDPEEEESVQAIPKATPKKSASPSKSPYVGATMKLQFDDKIVVRIPQSFIKKHPKFAAHFTDRQIDLSDMTENQAHILVHYLYTGKYQPLEPQGSSAAEKRAKAFAISLWVYSNAIEYDLEHLAALAAIELTKLGAKLTFLEIVRIIDREEFQLEEHEVWLAGYLAERADMSYEPISEGDAKALRAGIGERRTLVNLLLETIVDLKLELQRNRVTQGGPKV
ncbi:hypothetical protein FZEAL_9398 [Fusarium zealandicum]|uniref:BTB domain-containing protein n=1 Tax=Fusarium zealandicum TaxID=1053134 RepID=A0A8H4UBE4_9HYPO|nr:hypothetical protein FZEAL_9398 [Fusarium zealandicum]